MRIELRIERDDGTLIYQSRTAALDPYTRDFWEQLRTLPEQALEAMARWHMEHAVGFEARS